MATYKYKMVNGKEVELTAEEIKYLEDYKNDNTINKIIDTGVNININKISIN